MCGRYSLAIDMEDLENRFTFEGEGLPRQARFNIAPTQGVLTVTNDGSRNHAQFMKWGLIPFWAKDPSIGNRMINARAETVEGRPMFRQAFQKHRCLVLADGFYEWMKVGKGRVPMRIILKSGEPFGFAGLWETWNSPEGVLVHSCTIITTTANAVMEPIHNRMPAILPREAENLWLAPGEPRASELKELLVPYSASDMEAYQVSALVNSPGNDMPDVMARVV
ncbi:MAG: SOS response-associated peptidase [Chloroflexota bacterium]